MSSMNIPVPGGPRQQPPGDEQILGDWLARRRDPNPPTALEAFMALQAQDPPRPATVLTGAGDANYSARRRLDLEEEVVRRHRAEGTDEGSLFPLTAAQRSALSARLAEGEFTRGEPGRDEALWEALQRRRPRQRGI